MFDSQALFQFPLFSSSAMALFSHFLMRASQPEEPMQLAAFWHATLKGML